MAEEQAPAVEKKVIGATSLLSFPVAWLKVWNKGDTLSDHMSQIITYAYGKCEQCCFLTIKNRFYPDNVQNIV